MMRSTLKQIAEATGYSIATVSRALNGSQKITAEAKRAILQQARRSGYRTECRNVALIVPHFQFDGYFGGVLRILATELARMGFTSEVIGSENLAVLEEHSFCGAISIMAQNGLERYWGNRHIMPLVCINTQPRHLDGIYTVASNDEQGVRLAVDHLTGLGHQRIGRFGGFESFHDPANWNSMNREQAFRRLLAEQGLEPELYASSSGGVAPTLDALKSLLDREVTAIITVNEGLELETLYALDLLSIRVPEEISVLSWTQPTPAEYLKPTLSGLEQNFPELIRAGCEMFRSLLTGNPVEDILVDYRLVPRGSTAPPGKRKIVSSS